MAYTEQAFKRHFATALLIRLGAAAAKGSPDQQTVDAAWKLYEKTRSAPLEAQVFGRHKNNPSDEPGIELFGEVFPKIEKKRLFGLYTGRESTKERDERIRKAGFVLKHPTHGRPLSPVEFNFGVTSDVSSGSILMMGQSWNLTVNDAWLLGGVHAQQPFYLAFRATYKNIFSDTYKHNLTITGREMLGLLLSGYRLKSGGESLGEVMVCENPTKADRMNLVEYAAAAQNIENPLKGKDMLIGLYNDESARKNIPADLLKEAEDAIKDADKWRGKYVEMARAAKVDLSAS